MRGVTAVLFDLDNTLVDRDGAVAAWLRETAPPATVGRLLALDAGGDGPRPVFFAAVAQASCGSPQEARESFHQRVPEHAVALPAALRTVDRLAAGHRLGIASNGASRLQRAKLRAAGFDPGRFAAIVISQEIGAAKPHPAFWRAAVQRIGEPAERVLLVGDHPRNDIAGAHAAGLRTCWLRTPRYAEPAEADCVIDRLDGIPLP